MEDTELKVGGFTFRGWYIAAALPILSAISGGIYYGYDTLNRFYAVETGIDLVTTEADMFNVRATDFNSRIQALEQAVADNDVRGLNTRLSTISTQMQTIWNNRKTCWTYVLKLKSRVQSRIKSAISWMFIKRK